MQIKYLYSSFKNARKEKVSSEYLFYLQLQSIQFPQNEMYKGSLIKEIQKHFDYSPASISCQLKKLVKAGFVDLYKHDSNKEWKYIIKSYRHVWNKLGFRFREYIDRYKFDFIDSMHLKDKASFKAMIFTLELKRNKNNQQFKEKEKVENKIKYHQDTLLKTKSKKIRKKKEKALLQLKSIKTSLEEVLTLDRSIDAKRPMENRISCKRASSLMGFKTPMSTVNLHKKAQNLQLLSVNKQITLVATNIPKIQFAIDPQFINCYWKFGKVFRNECNTYSIININQTKFNQDLLLSQTL